jgi:hypothetical protein
VIDMTLGGDSPGVSPVEGVLIFEAGGVERQAYDEEAGCRTGRRSAAGPATASTAPTTPNSTRAVGNDVALLTTPTSGGPVMKPA